MAMNCNMQDKLSLIGVNVCVCVTSGDEGEEDGSVRVCVAPTDEEKAWEWITVLWEKHLREECPQPLSPSSWCFLTSAFWPAAFFLEVATREMFFFSHKPPFSCSN